MLSQRIDRRTGQPTGNSMTRKKGLMFFGTFIVLNGVWFAWSARPFWVRPPVIYGPTVPSDVRNVAEQWLRDNPYYGRSGSFDLQRYFGYLWKPYEAEVEPIIVDFWAFDQDLLTIRRKRGRQIIGFHRHPVHGLAQQNNGWYGPSIH